MTPENSYLCDYTLVSIGHKNNHYSNLGVWADVKVDEAAHWMKHVVNNSAEAKAKGKRGKEDILRNFSTETVGKNITERLRTISSAWDPKESRSTQRNLYWSYLTGSIVQKSNVYYIHYRGAVLRRIEKLKSKVAQGPFSSLFQKFTNAMNK